MIVDRIIELADDLHVSKAYLCDLIGKKRSYFITCRKRGTENFSETDLSLLAKALNTTTDYLVGASTERSKAKYEFDILSDERIMQLIRDFRSLPVSDQDTLLLMARSFAARNEGSET